MSQTAKISCGDLVLLILRRVFFSIVFIVVPSLKCFWTQGLFSFRKSSLQKIISMFALQTKALSTIRFPSIKNLL